MDVTTYVVEGSEPNDVIVESIMGAMRAGEESFRADGNFRVYDLSVNGYDTDERALYQIPKVREWCGGLYRRFPAAFLFLHEKAVRWFYLAVAEIEVVSLTRNERPDGITAEYYAKLPPEQQQAFREKNPSLFLTATIRLAPSAEELSKTIFVKGAERLKTATDTREAYLRLLKEYAQRLETGLPNGLPAWET